MFLPMDTKTAFSLHKRIIKMEPIEINPIFNTVKVTQDGLNNITKIRYDFSSLLLDIEEYANGGSRELAIVKTKLEEACMFAIKAISIGNKIDEG